MSKYVYTAFLEPEEGRFNIFFPDLEGCYTCGDDIEDALKMASDALGSYLTWEEDHNKSIPVPSDPSAIIKPDGAIQALIETDTELYRRQSRITGEEVS